ncbi:MAG: DUF120 domain-containing protein [Methanoregulaceae archaeon]|nr:DUF120 domain-containing protein [Methanoregulaceae archaeon]
MLIPEDLQCLKAIALMGNARGPVWVSSQVLGGTLGASPQTASRRLQSLERQHCIARTAKPDGQYITITKEGEEELRREYAEYRRIFERGSPRYRLTGHVVTGLGEGRYYMGLPPYRQQFLEHLGFEPYPGTLNLRLDAQSIRVRRELDRHEWVPIAGFVADGRTFGSAKCLPCRIADIPCGIVVPGRTHYPEDVIEVVSPIELRPRLGLADMDQVTVEISDD